MDSVRSDCARYSSDYSSCSGNEIGRSGDQPWNTNPSSYHLPQITGRPQVPVGSFSWNSYPHLKAPRYPGDLSSPLDLPSTSLAPGGKRIYPNYTPKYLSQPTPSSEKGVSQLQSISGTSTALTAHTHVKPKMPAIELVDHDGPDVGFVDLVSDDHENLDDWNDPFVSKRRAVDTLHPPTMGGAVASDPASSIPRSEPAAGDDSPPSSSRASPTSFRGNATRQTTPEELSLVISPLQDASDAATDSDDVLLVSDIPSSAMERSNTSDMSKALPSTIREVLEKWYAREGRQKPPPCAVRKAVSKTVNTTFTGGPVTYVYTTGEVLAVEMYALPEFFGSRHDKQFILVAAGDTQGPFIIAYLDNKTEGKSCRSMRYLIWEGIDSPDKDGWEEQPSIRKVPEPQSEVRYQHQPSTREIPQQQTTVRSQHSDLPDVSSAIPPQIRSLLDDWYAREGHKRPPPCATTIAKNIRYDYKSRPVTYACKNGEVLAVEMFILPEFADTAATHKYVTVARSATLGHFIIGYLRSRPDGKGSNITEYRIWKGTNSQDPNGWDETLLVEKRSGAQPLSKNRKIGEGVGAINPPVPVSKSLVVQNVWHQTPRELEKVLQISPSSAIPSKIRNLINEWCLVQGPEHSVPFATKTKDPYFTSSSNGTPAYFKHDNGIVLGISSYSLNSQRPQDQGYNVIIAQGRGSGPFLIMRSNKGEGIGCSSCVYYYTWIGLNGDADGFADTFSIAKYFSKPSKTKDKDIPSSKMPLYRRGSVAAASTQSSPMRRRLDIRTNTSLESSPSLHEHVRNNAVLLFFSTSSETPRVRLLCTCDSVQKLFAQALAGDLFEESRKGPKILSVKLADPRKACKVVEDDEDDFEDLLSAIAGLSCWSVTGHATGGSCTVEVRAVS